MDLSLVGAWLVGPKPPSISSVAASHSIGVPESHQSLEGQWRQCCGLDTDLC